MKEIANEHWKKEDELKGFKSKLAAIDRKVQLELTKNNEPKKDETQSVASSNVVQERSKSKDASNKGS